MTAKINELPVFEGERVLRFLIDHCDKPNGAPAMRLGIE
jgi:hypothetical protein